MEGKYPPSGGFEPMISWRNIAESLRDERNELKRQMDKLADEVQRLREVAEQVTHAVERNRQQGVYTDEDWLIGTLRAAVRCEGE